MAAATLAPREETMRLSELPAIDRDEDAVRVIIEAPRGARNKFKYEADLDVFALDRVLPLGTAFPFDFGFVPSTLAEDGDPIDVMVFADEPLSVGCLVLVKLIGVIEATQQERGGKPKRNDRLIGVSRQTIVFRSWTSLRRADGGVIQGIEQFFVAYNNALGRNFRPLARGGAARAHQLLTEAIRRAERAGS
jgi:inorganic pyrophosphatase